MANKDPIPQFKERLSAFSSESEVPDVTQLAMSLAKHFKFVVFHIESAIRSANTSLRYPLLALIDAILKTAEQNGNANFKERFARKGFSSFKTNIKFLTRVSVDNQKKIYDTVKSWGTAGIYPANIAETLIPPTVIKVIEQAEQQNVLFAQFEQEQQQLEQQQEEEEKRKAAEEALLVNTPSDTIASNDSSSRPTQSDEASVQSRPKPQAGFQIAGATHRGKQTAPSNNNNNNNNSGFPTNSTSGQGVAPGMGPSVTSTVVGRGGNGRFPSRSNPLPPPPPPGMQFPVMGGPRPVGNAMMGMNRLPAPPAHNPMMMNNNMMQGMVARPPNMPPSSMTAAAFMGNMGNAMVGQPPSVASSSSHTTTTSNDAQASDSQGNANAPSMSSAALVPSSSVPKGASENTTGDESGVPGQMDEGGDDVKEQSGSEGASQSQQAQGDNGPNAVSSTSVTTDNGGKQAQAPNSSNSMVGNSGNSKQNMNPNHMGMANMNVNMNMANQGFMMPGTNPMMMGGMGNGYPPMMFGGNMMAPPMPMGMQQQNPGMMMPMMGHMRMPGQPPHPYGSANPYGDNRAGPGFGSDNGGYYRDRGAPGRFPPRGPRPPRSGTHGGSRPPRPPRPEDDVEVLEDLELPELTEEQLSIPIPASQECPPGCIRLLSATIWIGGLREEANIDKVYESCKPYGCKDKSHIVMRDFRQAFVILSSYQAAAMAKRDLDGKPLSGCHSPAQVNFGRGFAQKGTEGWNANTGVSYLPIEKITSENLRHLVVGCVVDRATCPIQLLHDLERFPHVHFSTQPDVLEIAFGKPSEHGVPAEERAPALKDRQLPPLYPASEIQQRASHRDRHHHGSWEHGGGRRGRDDSHGDRGYSREHPRESRSGGDRQESHHSSSRSGRPAEGEESSRRHHSRSRSPSRRTRDGERPREREREREREHSSRDRHSRDHEGSSSRRDRDRSRERSSRHRRDERDEYEESSRRRSSRRHHSRSRSPVRSRR